MCLGDVQRQPGPGPHQRAQVEGLNLGDELVELVGVPPAVLVRLAEPELALGHYPRPEAVVVHGYVAGLVAADLDPGIMQDLEAQVPGFVEVGHGASRLRFPLAVFTSARTPDRIRTRNLRGRNPPLYPFELRGRVKTTSALSRGWRGAFSRGPRSVGC